MNDDLYQEIILEEYAHPQNRGTFAEADATLRQRNASCGDEVTLYLKLNATHEQVKEIKWEGEGCAVSMAAMSLLSQKLQSEHTHLADIAQMTREDMEKLLGLEHIAEGRVRCMMLGVTALQKYYDSSKGKSS